MRPFTLFMKSENAHHITPDKVTYDDADIHSYDLQPMRLKEGNRNGKIIEGIGHAVCEATYDKERNSKKEREIVLFARESHRRGHYESATYAQKAATKGTIPQSNFKYLLRSSLKIKI